MTFREFISIHKSVWGALTAVVAAGPLAMSALTNLAPPWPKDVVGGIGTMACILAVMLGYLIADRLDLFSKELSRRKRTTALRRAFRISIGLLPLSILSLLAYANFYSLYVVSLERTINGEAAIERWVVGTERLPDVNQVKPDIEVLRDEGFDPIVIWTPHSLRNARMCVLSSFLVTFVLLTLSTVIFAAYTHVQGRHKCNNLQKE